MYIRQREPAKIVSKEWKLTIVFLRGLNVVSPDGNGRVGRLIMFKECLKYNIVPFIIEDNLKMFYYRGLMEWDNEKGYLTDICLTAQDKYKAYLDYFRIGYMPQQSFWKCSSAI